MLTNADSEASASDAQSANLDPRIEMREEGGVLTCKLSGNWTTRRVVLVDKAMRDIPNGRGIRELAVDISAIGRMDTAGAWLIERLISAVRAKGVETRIEGKNEVASILLGAVGAATRKRKKSTREGGRTSSSAPWPRSASASTKCGTIFSPR